MPAWWLCRGFPPGLSCRCPADLVARAFLAPGVRLRLNPHGAKMQRCFCSFMMPSCGLILLDSVFNV